MVSSPKTVTLFLVDAGEIALTMVLHVSTLFLDFLYVL